VLPEDIEQDLLYRPVCLHTWSGLTPGVFARKYRDEVSDLNDLVLSTHDVALPLYGQSTVYSLHNGYTVLVSHNGKWSLFESATLHKSRSLIRAWAEFTRGRWVRRTPTSPGQYAVKDADLGKRSFRELRIVHGRLRDVTGGPVSFGNVSDWHGYWWLPAIPQLPDSF